MPTTEPPTPGSPPEWLADGLIYEIYPQSFADSNGDGIGDLPGVIDRLDYLAWLGVDVIWFNPCFASPFRDAGYDVSDYLTIAPRYGTNDDMIALIGAARTRGIRVLLDLVAGHTSIDHPWFVASSNDPADDRYVWASAPGEAMVPSPGSRPGWYLKNFFPEQPPSTSATPAWIRPSRGDSSRTRPAPSRIARLCGRSSGSGSTGGSLGSGSTWRSR